MRTFDILSPGFHANPFPTLGMMQAEGPVVRLRVGPGRSGRDRTDRATEAPGGCFIAREAAPTHQRSASAASPSGRSQVARLDPVLLNVSSCVRGRTGL